MFERAVKVGSLTSDEYKQLNADLQRRARAQIDGALAKHKLDAPTASSPTSSTGTCRRRWRARRSTSRWGSSSRSRTTLATKSSFLPPPTANVLDFLDAPQRLMEALDSATMKWFVQAFQAGGKFSLNLVAKSAATILRAIGRITGGAFLEAMAVFIGELNDLFGGFKERAARVEAVFRGDESRSCS